MVKTNLFAAAVGMTLLASAAQAANDTSFRPFHAVLPPESSAALATGSPVSVGLSDEERAVNAGARAGSPISITTADLVAALPASA
jgi:hypothetical protein